MTKNILRLRFKFDNSASAVDLTVPIVVDGLNYGAPLENLRAAMRDAGVPSVDLWIGSTGAAVAALVVPVLKPKAFLPVHWDGLWGAFNAGVEKPFADPATEAYLAKEGITVIKPREYMDKWRLDATGVRGLDNRSVKQALGFTR